MSKWDSAVEIRSEQIGSGLDVAFNNIFVPLYESYFLKYKPQTVFEIGAGTGHLAMKLQSLTAEYIAIEPSVGMYNYAHQHLKQTKVKLINCGLFDYDYKTSHDLIISHFVLHVIEDLDKLFDHVYNLLSPGGKFIFIIPHPYFYDKYKNLFDNAINYKAISSNLVDLTITMDSRKIHNLPYIHRPIEAYINTAISHKLNIHKFEEIVPDVSIQKLFNQVWEFPRYLKLIVDRNT